MTVREALCRTNSAHDLGADGFRDDRTTSSTVERMDDIGYAARDERHAR
jgi:hypothetical protein